MEVGNPTPMIPAGVNSETILRTPGRRIVLGNDHFLGPGDVGTQFVYVGASAARSRGGQEPPPCLLLKCKIDFQDAGHGGLLGFPVRTNNAVFDLQVTRMLPTKFQVNWPFRSE